MDQNIRELTINTIRMLSAEAIEKANSGHPGLPLGAAPIAYAVWMENLKHNPADPSWHNRDRFVLSAGHGSMLDYSMLYLFGYGLTKEDLMEFRQFMSKTPGHPEYRHTVGVETTTGPLGQGVANAVGMAIAEAHLAAKFNRPEFPIVDHYTYAICGDGCMQEGIEYEAASLAGTLKLGKLIVLYDRNKITIEGNTDIAFTEDVRKRHEAQGWHVVEVADGNNVDLITKAIKKAKKVTDKPSLIICNTTIGFGSPKAGSESSHGAPLGAKALEETRKNLNWTYEPFEVPTEVEDFLAQLRAKCKRMQNKWKRLLKKYKAAYPELYAEYDAWMSGKLPDLIDDDNL